MSYTVRRGASRIEFLLRGTSPSANPTSFLDALHLVVSGALIRGSTVDEMDIVAHHEAYKCRPFTKTTHGLDFVVVRAKITSLYSSPGGHKPPARRYPHSKYLMMSVYEMEAMQGLKSMP